MTNGIEICDGVYSILDCIGTEHLEFENKEGPAVPLVFSNMLITAGDIAPICGC